MKSLTTSCASRHPYTNGHLSPSPGWATGACPRLGPAHWVSTAMRLLFLGKPQQASVCPSVRPSPIHPSIHYFSRSALGLGLTPWSSVPSKVYQGVLDSAVPGDEGAPSSLVPGGCRGSPLGSHCGRARGVSFLSVSRALHTVGSGWGCPGLSSRLCRVPRVTLKSGVRRGGWGSFSTEMLVHHAQALGDSPALHTMPAATPWGPSPLGSHSLPLPGK